MTVETAALAARLREIADDPDRLRAMLDRPRAEKEGRDAGR